MLLTGLMISGCISTYRDYPRVTADAAELATTERPLFYSNSRELELELSLVAFGQTKTLQKVFEGTGGFTRVSRVKAGDLMPDGLYVLVYTGSVPDGEAANLWGEVLAHPVPLGLFPFSLVMPFFSMHGGYTVSYTLYVDGVLQKQYQYRIIRKLGGWVAFLPFIWVNLFTPSAKGAFRSTAYAFVRDARADGLLPAPAGDEERTARR